MAYILTATGNRFHYDLPVEEMVHNISIQDIATSLSKTCRYGGHSLHFYSVAEHSVLVARALEKAYPHYPDLAMYGLLHDASEAYIRDLPGPFKATMSNHGEYAHMERKIQCAVYRHEGLDYPSFGWRYIVNTVDELIYAAEQPALFPHIQDEPRWVEDNEFFSAGDGTVKCLPWNKAYSLFMDTYNDLVRRKV